MELTSEQKLENKKTYAVSGLFENKPTAEQAIINLKDMGFRQSDIDLSMQQIEEEKSQKKHDHEIPRGATTGALMGILFGLSLGWLVGIGVLSIPGIVLLGIVIPGCTLLGGLAGTLLSSKFLNRKKGKEKLQKTTGILLSIHCDDSDWANRANKLLEVLGAQNIFLTSEHHH